MVFSVSPQMNANGREFLLLDFTLLHVVRANQYTNVLTQDRFVPRDDGLDCSPDEVKRNKFDRIEFQRNKCGPKGKIQGCIL